jgi:hypothetical protein
LFSLRPPFFNYETFDSHPFLSNVCACPVRCAAYLFWKQPICPGSGLNFFHTAKKRKKGQTLIACHLSICKAVLKISPIKY